MWLYEFMNDSLLKRAWRHVAWVRHRQRSVNVQRRAERYLNRHPDLRATIEMAIDGSGSTGVSVSDYVALHEVITTQRPKCILETGTGKSTFVIAHALREIGGGQLVSMEHNADWHAEQVRRFPKDFDFVDIRLSPMVPAEFGMISGVAYEEVPDLPYDFAFIDGPSPKGKACLDFLHVVQRNRGAISALVDNRKPTMLALAIIFGKAKIRYLEDWGLGAVSPVTESDILPFTAAYKDIIDPDTSDPLSALR